jgi:hypothetical protein
MADETESKTGTVGIRVSIGVVIVLLIALAATGWIQVGNLDRRLHRVEHRAQLRGPRGFQGPVGPAGARGLPGEVPESYMECVQGDIADLAQWTRDVRREGLTGQVSVPNIGVFEYECNQ